jgi:hypothetical protein
MRRVTDSSTTRGAFARAALPRAAFGSSFAAVAHCVLAALAALAAGVPNAAQSDAPPAAPNSLEQLARELAARRAERELALAPRLSQLVAELDALSIGAPTSERARLRESLLGLGCEAGPGLVPALDAGAAPSAAGLARAELVRDVLIELRCEGLVAELARLTHGGSARATAHAFAVLAHAPLAERAAATQAIVAWLAAARANPKEGARNAGESRLAALRALARLPDPAGLAALERALIEEDHASTNELLRVLAEARRSDLAPAVLALTLHKGAGGVAEGLCAYYLAQPEVCGDAEIAALSALATRAGAPQQGRIAVLDALPRLRERWTAELRAPLEAALVEDRNARADDAFQLELRLCLARTGDKAARRELLRRCDAQVAENPLWRGPLATRAEIYERLGDYDQALRDWRSVIALQLTQAADEGEARSASISLARVQVRMGRLRDASQTLERAGLRAAEREALAADPVFAPLREHPRYGKVLTDA